MDNASSEILETITAQMSKRFSQNTVSVGFALQNQNSPVQKFDFARSNQDHLLNISIIKPLRFNVLTLETRYSWWLLNQTQVNAVDCNLRLIGKYLPGAALNFGYEVKQGVTFLQSFNCAFDYKLQQGTSIKFGYRKTNPNNPYDYDRELVAYRSFSAHGLKLDNYLYFHVYINI